MIMLFLFYFISFTIFRYSPSVSIQTISKTYPGQRDYSKYFSGKMVMKMARHLEACHADEHEITSLPEKSKSSSDIRNKTFEKLSKLENFHQNINALTKKSGNLIIGKRAKTRAKKLKNTYDANFVWFFSYPQTSGGTRTKTCKFHRFHQLCTHDRRENPQDHLQQCSVADVSK